MNMSLLLLGLLCVAYISRRIRKRSPYNDFDLAGMNEKFQIAAETRRALNAAEQLMTELQTSSPERQIVVHMEWIGDNENVQAYDLYCDGYNMATDRMREIFEREINDLRNEFSYECSELQKATRGRKNHRKYGEQIRRMGEWINAGEDVRSMWWFNGDT